MIKNILGHQNWILINEKSKSFFENLNRMMEILKSRCPERERVNILIFIIENIDNSYFTLLILKLDNLKELKNKNYI